LEAMKSEPDIIIGKTGSMAKLQTTKLETRNERNLFMEKVLHK
jgi:hypothetical protein